MNNFKPFETLKAFGRTGRISHHPAVDFLVTFLRARVERSRSEDLSRGASAVEWVIISAVVVAIVGVVAAIINAALTSGATKVGNCIQGASASKTC